MFEAAEIGHAIDEKTYARKAPVLRAALLAAQADVLAAAEFPVVIVVGGVDAGGKGKVVNQLNAWMDPRHIATWALATPTASEAERPNYWRFWRALPPKGRIGIFAGSWHSAPIMDRVARDIDPSTFEARLEEQVRFERLLTDEGALVLKFWLHLSKAQQKKTLTALEKDKLTRWRVTPLDWARLKQYDRFRKVSEHALLRTSTGHAPWIIVEAADPHYRTLTVCQAILDAMRARLASSQERESGPTNASGAGRRPTRALREAIKPSAQIDGKTLLASTNLALHVSDADYDRDIEALQGRLNAAMRHPKAAQIGVVALFEGPDAAGKGGSIRRITAALDARNYRVVPIAAPTDEERAQPYLWRFWRHIPARGHMTIFDRSWYGRVLVERVEGFAAPDVWGRAYHELNDFEAQLHAHGIVVLKFWLQIDLDEQLRRFKRRERTKFRRFKLTADDWRNRSKWDENQQAASEMIERTSVDDARWTIVEANDKNHARLKVLRTMCERLEDALARR